MINIFVTIALNFLLSIAHAQTGNYSTSCLEKIPLTPGPSQLTCFVGLGVAVEYNNWAPTTQWNFGDGTTATGNPTHKWLAKGTYQVSETIPGNPQDNFQWTYVADFMRGWCAFNGYIQWWTPTTYPIGSQFYLQPTLASCKALIATAVNDGGICRIHGLPRRKNLIRINGTYQFLSNKGSFSGTCANPSQLTFH